MHISVFMKELRLTTNGETFTEKALPMAHILYYLHVVLDHREIILSLSSPPDEVSLFFCPG